MYKKKKRKHRKLLPIFVWIVFLAASFYCYMHQGNYLYLMVFPKGTFVVLTLTGWVLVAIAVFMWIRPRRGYSSKISFKEKLKIAVIAESLSFLVALVVAIMWIPVCLVISLKLNSSFHSEATVVNIYKINTSKLSKVGGTRKYLPDYTKLIIRDIKSGNIEEFFLTDAFYDQLDGRGVTHVGLVTRQGLFGWKTVIQQPYFFTATEESDMSSADLNLTNQPDTLISGGK